MESLLKKHDIDDDWDEKRPGQGVELEVESKKRVEGSILPPVPVDIAGVNESDDLTVQLKTFIIEWLRNEVNCCIQQKMAKLQRAHRHVLDLPQKFENLDWVTVTDTITEVICDKAYDVRREHKYCSNRLTIYYFSW